MTECNVSYVSYASEIYVIQPMIVHAIYTAITQYGVVLQGDKLIPWSRVLELNWDRDKIDDPFG